MDDDPFLQELLGDIDDGQATTQGTAGSSQHAGQGQPAAGHAAATPPQSGAQAHVIAQLQLTPQSPQQPNQASQAAAAQRNKLLNSGTLTMVVSILVKLLQDDHQKVNLVKQAVRQAQVDPESARDPKGASSALMTRLGDLIGWDKLKQAITLQQKMRNQAAQAALSAQRGANGVQAPPPQQQGQGQQGLGQQPASVPMPAQQARPQQPVHQAAAVARGVSPAPAGHALPQQAAQAGQPHQLPRPQQQVHYPAAMPGQPTVNIHLQQQQQHLLQQQQQQQQQHQAAQQMGSLAPGVPLGRTPSPGGVYAGNTPMLPITGQAVSAGGGVMPGITLPQVAGGAAASLPQPRPKPAQPLKRAADGAADDGRDAKRAKAPAGGKKEKEKEKEGDIHDILDADAFIDMEQETDNLMAGLAHQRQMGTARLAKTQLLSEWRVANEMLKQMTKAGLKSVRPECFEILQLAFQAHATRILAKAHNMARHRQDSTRRLPEMVTTSDPRRGVGQIDRRERERHDARLALEREELLKAATSKKADEETKEKAQKAKAELQGKQQASAANAAVAATLGGGKGAKWNKWDKWGGGGGAGGGGGGAGGGKKKGGRGAGAKAAAAAAAKDGEGGAGTAAEGTAGAAAAAQPSGGGDAGPGVRFAEPPSGAAGNADGAKVDRAGNSLQVGYWMHRPPSGMLHTVFDTSRSRAVLPGLAGGAAGDGGGDGGDTIHLRDVVAALERDPMYCRSPLLYTLNNRVL
ncbi:hypothetical protein N2152v2_008357 [Parachlorella kessleri]